MKNEEGHNDIIFKSRVLKKVRLGTHVKLQWKEDLKKEEV